MALPMVTDFVRLAVADRLRSPTIEHQMCESRASQRAIPHFIELLGRRMTKAHLEWERLLEK